MAKKNKFSRDLHGLLVLDKSLGISSSQALQRVKYLFNAKKAGHTGTLDPLATGALVICFGRATKIADHVMESEKSYYVVAKLGEQTDTGDKEGEVIKKGDVTASHIAQITNVVEKFQGEIEQIPPMYSAIKKDGVPLYKLAREGKEVDRKVRKIKIYSIAINEIQDNSVAMTVHCSKGTYIRTLVEDIGSELGCYAHVEKLRRLSVGHYGNSHQMHTFEQMESLHQSGITVLDRLILPIETAFSDYPKIIFKNGVILAMEKGIRTSPKMEISSKYIRIYDTNQAFRGLGQVNEDGSLHFSNFSFC